MYLLLDRWPKPDAHKTCFPKVLLTLCTALLSSSAKWREQHAFTAVRSEKKIGRTGYLVEKALNCVPA